MLIGFFLIGSVLGLSSAVVAMTVFGAGFLTALAIWSGVGLAVVALGLTIAVLPRRQEEQSSLRTAGTI